MLERSLLHASMHIAAADALVRRKAWALMGVRLMRGTYSTAGLPPCQAKAAEVKCSTTFLQYWERMRLMVKRGMTLFRNGV